VEKIAGKPIEQFVQERIITPLGLKTTWFVVKYEDLILRRIGGYLIAPDGSFKNMPYLIPWSQAYGVGTVHSTVDEISKFVAALFNGTLLNPESAARVTTPRLMKDGKPSPYGYGNLFVFAEGKAPMVRVSGSTSTTQVYSLSAPEEKAFVAVFSSLSTHFPNTPNPYFPGPPAKEIALMLAEKQ
jgi:CubicO group peptidase (beta-lactamase class C family)